MAINQLTRMLAVLILFHAVSANAECGKKFFGVEACANFEETAQRLDAKYGAGKQTLMGRTYEACLFGSGSLAMGADGFVLLGNRDLGVVGVRVAWHFTLWDVGRSLDETLAEIQKNITAKYGPPSSAEGEHTFWVDFASETAISCIVVKNRRVNSILCDLGDLVSLVKLERSVGTEYGF